MLFRSVGGGVAGSYGERDGGHGGPSCDGRRSAMGIPAVTIPVSGRRGQPPADRVMGSAIRAPASGTRFGIGIVPPRPPPGGRAPP